MELTAGFRQTAVGPIPNDWGFGTLRDLVDPIRTIRYGIVQPGRYDDSGRYMIRGQDYSRGWVDSSELFRVSARIEEPFANARVQAGDVLMTIVGASTGRIAIVPAWLDGANLTQTTARIALRADRIDGAYCAYALAGPIGSRQVSGYLKGGAQPGLNCGDIEKFVIPLPPRPEQEAIAAALSDLDALLEGLTRLIDKKRELKHAGMQQLLTGRTRLPGFEGHWATKKIGEIATPSSARNRAGDDLPVLSCSKHLGFVESLSYFKNRVFSEDLTGYRVIRRGEIGYPANHIEEGSIGLQDLYDAALVSPIYVVFSVSPLMNSYFLHRQLKLDRYRHTFRMATASSVDRRGSLRWPAFSEITVGVPPISEQAAIATVLSDMDAELTALEARHAKMQELKQAMMEALLTGRSRLVTSESAYA